ncbi:hypothetical protein E2C01_086787 [Portunus trituberculatus]|uniref:Uncharacterized protein n=1 Tax=Portunus trituberculatus TaxID=210409 RepID=A0A5B7J1S2_PORTR|nr:hypothetical protein [Portunus trituberculatus]
MYKRQAQVNLGATSRQHEAQNGVRRPEGRGDRCPLSGAILQRFRPLHLCVFGPAHIKGGVVSPLARHRWHW